MSRNEGQHLHQGHKEQHHHDDHHIHHGHSHTPLDFSSYGKAFYIGISLNFLYALIEFLWGRKENSLSLMTDAIHNFGDVFGLVIAYVGYYFSKSKTTLHFTYGLRKFSILAAFLNALILVIGTLWLMKEAIERFQSQQPLAGSTLMIVAGIGIIINFSTALLFYRGSQHDLNMKGAFLHLIADAAVSVCVVIGGGVILWQGWKWVDPVVSLLIGVVILWGTWGLLKESTVLVLGGVPEQINLEKVLHYLKNQNGVDEVHDLHVWAMSTTEVALTAHMVMKRGHPGDEYLANLSHQLIHEFNIHHSTFQIEVGDAGEPCHYQKPGAV